VYSLISPKSITSCRLPNSPISIFTHLNSNFQPVHLHANNFSAAIEKFFVFPHTYLYLPNKTKSEIWVLLNKQPFLSLENIINARLLSDGIGKQADSMLEGLKIRATSSI
jgi:hypothetical protein